MERLFVLKVYTSKGVEVVELPNKMFQTKVMKENAEVAKRYMDKKYPCWKRAVLITTYKRENHHISQRILIERPKTLTKL